MTTFNTEFGRYRYTVMPFGATVAGDYSRTSWMNVLVTHQM